MTAPRLESGLPDDWALLQQGVRNESAFFAPPTQDGGILAPETGYVRLQQDATDPGAVSLYDGQDFTPLSEA